MTIKLQLFPSSSSEGIFKYDGYDYIAGCILPPSQIEIAVEEEAYRIQEQVCKHSCERFLEGSVVQQNLQERALKAKGTKLKSAALERFTQDFYRKSGKCRGRLADVDNCPEGYRTQNYVTLNTPELLFTYECDKDEFYDDYDDSDYSKWRLLFNRGNGSYVPYCIGNVYDSGKICWGDVDFPKDHLQAVQSFFASNFNWDLMQESFKVYDEPSSQDNYSTEYDDDDDEEYYWVYPPQLIKDYHAWYDRYYEEACNHYANYYYQGSDVCRRAGAKGILYGTTGSPTLANTPYQAWDGDGDEEDEDKDGEDKGWVFYGWVLERDGSQCLIEVPKKDKEPVMLMYDIKTKRLSRLETKERAPA